MLISFSAATQNFDIRILREINQDSIPALVSVNSFLSDYTTFFVFTLIVALFVLAYFKKNRTLRLQSMYLFTSVALTDLSTNVLKYIVQRERPFLTYTDIMKYGEGGGYSFPSGHTAEAFAMATAISLTYRKWYIVVPAYLWACAVGYSRMQLGTHYPTDVLIGMVLGGMISLICYRFFPR